MKTVNPTAEHYKITNLKNTFFNKSAWPSVCVDERGVLYAVASSMRLSHVDPTGKSCMFMSFDGGKSWTLPIVINDSLADDRDMGIVYLGNGKLLVSWFSSAYGNYLDDMQNADWVAPVHKTLYKGFTDAWKTMPRDEFLALNGSFVMISEDYGVTWSSPIRVPVTSPHGPALSKDGTLLYLGKRMDKNYKDFSVCLYTSRDCGYTWEFTGKISESDEVGFENMYEPHIAELPNGRLLGALRVGREAIPHETVYTVFSDDKGKTWSAPASLETDGIPPHICVHSSGAVILSYACRTNGKRAEHALVSYDGGENWSADYIIDDELPSDFCDMGYPCTIELSDKSLLSVYYQPLRGGPSTDLVAAKWSLK